MSIFSRKSNLKFKVIVIVKMSTIELNISELVMSGLTRMIGGIVCEAITQCGSVHNFDASEMIRSMNLEDIMRASSNKKVLKEKVVKEKVVKEKVVKEKVVKEKSKFPMPFNGFSSDECCSALRQNHGLYTQCETGVNEPGFCKKCGPEPIYGTIQQRLDVGIMEFRDPKGKSPTPFVKVLKKLKISREDVEQEADNLNIKINDIHFEEEEEVEKKEKGRPKKPRRKIELADDSTDLFAALVAKANEDSQDEDSSSEETVKSVKSVLDSVVDAIVDAEKEEVKQAKIQKKEEEAAAKAVLKQAEIQKKAEKEALKQAEIQKKEEEAAAKAVLKQAEILKKETAKQAEIQKKEDERVEKEAAKQKIAELKAEMEKLTAKKSSKAKKDSSDSETEKKVAKPAEKKAAKPAEKKAAKTKVEVEEEEVADVVKRFEFEGVKYLKSKNTGIVYNLEQDVVGKWNEKTSKIDFEEAGSEEEEDEYDV